MNNDNSSLLDSWIDIDSAALQTNIQLLAKTAHERGKTFMLMVKANAYGHGLVEISRIAAAEGATFLGVAHIEEALELRKNGIDTPLLLFTEPPITALALLQSEHISVIVNSFDFLQQVLAANQKAPLGFHIKINTGLNRFGFSPNEVPEIQSLLHEHNVEPEGIFTHYSSANDDLPKTKQEYEAFAKVLEAWKLTAPLPRFVHASNSAATVWLDEKETNLVRLGLAAYGLQPNPENLLHVKPALSWHTRIAAINAVPKGERLGYSGKWTAERDSIVGVLPVGYGDGLRRGPQHQPYVLGNGQRLPIIGGVMMSHVMIDLTQATGDFKVGQLITLIGTQGEEAITLEAIAKELGTINEEVVTGLSPLVRRYYR